MWILRSSSARTHVIYIQAYIHLFILCMWCAVSAVLYLGIWQAWSKVNVVCVFVPLVTATVFVVVVTRGAFFLAFTFLFIRSFESESEREISKSMWFYFLCR